MDKLKSIPFETEEGDHVILTASGFHSDPIRVLLVAEADYHLAIKSGDLSSISRAMPILSSDRPTIKLAMPFAGKWRIVYRVEDARSVTVLVEPSPST